MMNWSCPPFSQKTISHYYPVMLKRIELDFSENIDKTISDDLKLVVEGWNVPEEEIKF